VVARNAAEAGVEVEGSEIVGLVPRAALEDTAVRYLKVENFQPGLILENRLESVLHQQAKPTPDRTAASKPLGTPTGTLASMAQDFVDAVAADTPAPGGGSVSALAGALAAALGVMVARLTLKKKSFAEHYDAIRRELEQLEHLRPRLMATIDRDAESYNGVLRAMRSPKATEAEQAARTAAIEEANKSATLVPLETAEMIEDVRRIIQMIQPITMPQAASDLKVALAMADAGRAGAIENVRTNLGSMQDRAWAAEVEARLEKQVLNSNSSSG